MTITDARPHYKSAEQELADALEGTAPALTRTVAGLIGPARTLELAKAIARATDLAVRRHAFERLEDALVVVETALNEIPAECETPEAPVCDHADSLYGRCTACGMTWEQQAEARRG